MTRNIGFINVWHEYERELIDISINSLIFNQIAEVLKIKINKYNYLDIRENIGNELYILYETGTITYKSNVSHPRLKSGIK